MPNLASFNGNGCFRERERERKKKKEARLEKKEKLG